MIAGDGPEYRKLKSVAGGRVEFAGRVPDGELRELYASCRALILPGEEDFGMTAVEALASGKPVVALGRGGVLESVPLRDPLGGVFYDSPDEGLLESALSDLGKLEPRILPQDLQRYARRFSQGEFARKMAHALGIPETREASVKSA